MRIRAVLLAGACLLLVAAESAESKGGITFDQFWTFFLVGAAGAAALEVLKLYEYRGELSKVKYKRLLRDPLFWTVVVGMIAGSGFFAWAINAQAPNASTLQVATAGAAIRSLIRQGLGAGVANQKVKLGEPSSESITMRDIF